MSAFARKTICACREELQMKSYQPWRGAPLQLDLAEVLSVVGIAWECVCKCRQCGQCLLDVVDITPCMCGGRIALQLLCS